MGQLNQLLLALVAAGWIGGFGLASARIAALVERRPSVWFVIGAVAGPIALLVLRTAPPGRCRSCGTPTRGWQNVCGWCHEDVRSTPASTQAILERMSARSALPEAAPAPAPERPVPARPFVIRTEPVQPRTSTAADTLLRLPQARPVRPPALPSVMPAVSATVNPTATASSGPTPGTGRRKRQASRVAPPRATPVAVGTALERNGSPPSVDQHAPPLEPRSIPRVPRTSDALQVLATAIFVAGGARLEPGHRYGLALRSTRFLIIGPIDVDPSVVVVDRAVADVEVRTVQGRLIVSEPQSRSGLVLAFMSVVGPTPSELAGAINTAARAASGA